MRIVFNIDVAIDVPSFVQAGEVLDKITRDLDATVGTEHYDIAQFQTHHTPVKGYPSRYPPEPSQDMVAETPYADADMDRGPR
jgi:hypothetical protein